jgi:cytoskeleton protein RodZ
VQRVLQPGETLGVDGRLPFRLKIGNAAGTQLQFRGQSIDLMPVARDNVARLELK